MSLTDKIKELQLNHSLPNSVLEVEKIIAEYPLLDSKPSIIKTNLNQRFEKPSSQLNHYFCIKK